jgi:IS4 transposase
MGIRSHIARSTLADANENRDWRIYADFAQILIAEARTLYAHEDFGVKLQEASVYALDSTTIDLCLSLFPWARFRRTKAAIKLHTLLNLRGSIPEFIHISEGKMHDVKVLDILAPQPGAYYVMDRGYVDFARLYAIHQSLAFFVTRAKRGMMFYRLASRRVAKRSGLRSDQTIRLNGRNTATDYPEPLRKVRYHDEDNDKTFVFLTNNFSLPALTVAQLYKARWRVELFFKWTKQHLRIKAFFGTSENAVKTQVWIAVSVYVLVAILKKRLDLPHSLYTILQFLSVSLFEKTPMLRVFSNIADQPEIDHNANQLLLFEL